jgi:hypothetical protein
LQEISTGLSPSILTALFSWSPMFPGHAVPATASTIKVAMQSVVACADNPASVQGSGPQFASLVPGVDPYCRHCDLSSIQAGTIQWLNPDAFVSAVDPSTGAPIPTVPFTVFS